MKRRIKRPRPGVRRQQILAAIQNGDFMEASRVALHGKIPESIYQLQTFLRFRELRERFESLPTSLPTPRKALVLDLPEWSHLEQISAKGLCQSFLDLVVARDVEGIRAIAAALKAEPKPADIFRSAVLVWRDILIDRSQTVTLSELREYLGRLGRTEANADDAFLRREAKALELPLRSERRGRKQRINKRNSCVSSP